jgi:hypothetical protein
LTGYDKLLEEARTKAEAFRSTAKEYIPKMYWALRNENPNLTPKDARDRIEKDCFDIWSKRTILDALPDEAKDLKKQKSGQLSQKEANSAAVSAAPLSTKKKEEIMIDTKGKPIGKSIATPSTSLSTTNLMSTINGASPPSDNSDTQLQNNNDNDLLDFKFSLPLLYVWDHLFPFIIGNDNGEHSICFEGVLDIRSRKVISATIAGRISQME